MNYKVLELLLLERKERRLKEVVEADDMDKMMRLDDREDCGSICKECACDSLERPKKKILMVMLQPSCYNVFNNLRQKMV